MQLKYALLHCSYAAPMRVLDTLSDTESKVVARAVVAARVVPARAVVARGVVVTVAARDTVVLSRFDADDDFGDVRAVVPREIVVVVAARDDTAGDAVRTTVLRVVPVRAAVVVVRGFIF
jgi:hypothetical protein